MKSIKVRNKNAILEMLQGGVNFEKIVLLKNLEHDNLTKEILSIANKRGILIKTVPLQKMAKRRGGNSREVIFGSLIPENIWSLDNLLENLYTNKKNPFFLLLNRVEYENNIGIIARTAFAVGVNGLIFQGRENQFLNEETIHFSTGAIARIPLVKMNVFEAIKELQKNNISVFCLEMSGKPHFDENLTGPIAFVLGAEKRGLSNTILDRCDGKLLSIPMRRGINSLNVSTAAAILLYEKVRQEHNPLKKQVVR